MKLMTLNAHSLVEKEHERKLRQFVDGVLAEMPDMIALQEVNQTIAAPVADAALLTGYVPVQETVPVRADNHAAHAAQLLREAGVHCSWTYLPIKVGYGRFDEGLAVLSLNRGISRVESDLISRTGDYANWKTRKVLAVQLEGCPDWFCTVHMGWWEDEQEPFLAQWEALQAFTAAKTSNALVWLLGDFNSPANVRGEGYDCILAAGWYDTYLLAQKRDGGITISGVIDGWREKLEDEDTAGLRIDHIWCSKPVSVASSCVLFNGSRHPVVSDHYGVMIETTFTEFQTQDMEGDA